MGSGEADAQGHDKETGYHADYDTLCKEYRPK